MLAQITRQAEAVLTRQTDIEQYHVRYLRCQRGAHGIRAIHPGDPVAVRGQVIRDELPDVRVIIHHKDLIALFHYSPEAIARTCFLSAFQSPKQCCGPGEFHISQDPCLAPSPDSPGQDNLSPPEGANTPLTLPV